MGTIETSCISMPAWKMLSEAGFTVQWNPKAGEITTREAQDIIDFERMIG